MAYSPAPLALSSDPVQLIDQHPVPAVLIAVAALVAVVPLTLVVRRLLRAVVRVSAGTSAEHVLTVVAAAIATSVAAQGMWQFFGDVLHFSGPLRVLTFAFIEVSVITSAVRARASMRANYSAGVDGIAVWVLTCLSAVLSSLDAASFGEIVLRLTAPLVAAWLWERGMALERRRITGRTRINWRLTPERVLVRLGMADPTDRTAGEVDAHRRLMRLALAAKHARIIRAHGSTRAQRRAMGKLERAMHRAVEHGALGTDPGRQETLIAQLGVLYNSASLLDLSPAAPWAPQASDDESSDDMPQVASDSEDDRSPEPDPESDWSPDLRGHYWTPPVSPDRPAEESGAADLNVPVPTRAAKKTPPLSTLFLDALTRNQGAIKAACADLAQAGHKPPSKGYAYQLRRTWESRQTQRTPSQETPDQQTVSTHLTRVK